MPTMKLDSSWTLAFDSGDLRRGEGYFYAGAVHALAQTPDGWTAKVYGSSVYTTFVPFPAEGLEAMHCDCPRFANGYTCKHLAAACMAIEEGKFGDEATTPPSAKVDLAALVASVPETELRTFLLEALRRDEQLSTLFTQRFATIDVAASCRRLAKQIDAATWEYADRGFIDWRGALGFEQRYHELVHTSIDPLVARGAYVAALELSIQALHSLEPIEIDDSDGFFSSAIDDVEDMWDAWLKEGDDDFASALFERISRYLDEQPTDGMEREIHSYGADMARAFQRDRFVDLPTFSDRFIRLADAKLEQSQEAATELLAELEHLRAAMGMPEAPVDRCCSHLDARQGQLNERARHVAFSLEFEKQDIERWMLIKLRALRAGGASTDDLYDTAGKTKLLEPVCQYFVDLELERDDSVMATLLLQDCKAAQQTERGEGGYSVKLALQLADLLNGRDNEAMRDELRFLMEHGRYVGVPDVRTLWTRLRESYAPSEWEHRRDIELDRIDDQNAWRSCLAAEQLYDRLMDDVEREGLRALGGFEDELVERYPERVLKLYMDDLHGRRDYPGRSRKEYHRFATHLNHIKRIPGGAPEIARYVAQVRRSYPNRPALLDELSVV